MIRSVFAVLVVCVVTVLFASVLGASEQHRVINVSTVDQLYSAVNNARNVGARINLAPGTYLLSARNPEGKPRPNQGTLNLQPGMSLVGSEVRIDSNFDGVPDPVSPSTPDDFAVPGTETKIDGSELIPARKIRKDCAGQVLRMPAPMIAISRNNSISLLHLFGGPLVSIGEPVNPVDSEKNPNLSVQVQSTVLDGGGISAMTFVNSGCNARRARSVLIFSNNVVRNAPFGLLISNFLTGNAANDSSSGPEIQATVSYNLFYHTVAGLTARNIFGTDGGTITLEMTRNVFRKNAGNFVGFAGRIDPLAPPVGNRLRVTSRFDTFGAPSTTPSVLLIAGRSSDGVEPQPQHNVLEAEFIHSNFVRNKPARPSSPEIAIIGDSGSGSDNHAIVLIREATVKTSAGAPTFGTLFIQNETGSGSVPNTARLKGSREDFLQRNQGFQAPAAEFFVRE